jgi:hypothetical protein
MFIQKINVKRNLLVISLKPYLKHRKAIVKILRNSSSSKISAGSGAKAKKQTTMLWLSAQSQCIEQCNRSVCFICDVTKGDSIAFQLMTASEGYFYFYQRRSIAA